MYLDCTIPLQNNGGEKTNLNETDVLGLLPEALSADVHL